MSNINLWAVLGAAVADMVIGSAWYSPLLFYKPWLKCLGKTDQEMEAMRKRGMGGAIGGTFISSLVLGYVLAAALKIAALETVSLTLQLTFWLWLGFFFAGNFSHYVFQGRPQKLYFIDQGYNLVRLLIMAMILFRWS